MYCSDGEAELSAICLKKCFINFVGQFLFCFVLFWVFLHKVSDLGQWLMLSMVLNPILHVK